MNKKLLISLSALATITPILVITSCAQEVSITTNLVITSKADPILTKTDITDLKGTELPAQLTALQKLFTGEGLTSANQANFKVTVNETDKIVTLTANTGFTINDKSTLESNKYKDEINPTVTDLVITAIKDPALTKTDITDLKGTDNPKKLTALQKLFNGEGLKIENINNFKVAVDEVNKVVTLTANVNFTINGTNTLASNKYTDEVLPPAKTDLKIKAKTGEIALTQVEITDLTGTDTTKQLTVLNKLFEGNDLNASNQANFIVTVDTSKNIVTLTAKDNYTIDGGKTKLESSAYKIQSMNLDIKAIATPITLLENDVTNLTSTNTTTQLAALGKLFTGPGLSIPNLANIEVTKGASVVTLKAKTGFLINNKPDLKSNVYTTILEITPIQGDVEIQRTDLGLLEDTDTKKLPILRKLFSGNIQNNLANFTIEIPSDKQEVILKANANYQFRTGGVMIQKAYMFRQLSNNIPLQVEVKNPSPTLTPEEIAKLKEMPSISNKSAQLTIIEKLFGGSGIIDPTIRFFNIEVDEKNKTVTLRTKPGFVIGTSNTSTLKFITAKYT
ncbi:MAG: hypothetical protein ACRCRP_00490 [Metamycoplasmataceae bacterium]